MGHGKSKWTVKVAEGDVYAVPLPDGGYGRVVVARKDRGGGIFGYFFGPRLDGLPNTVDNGGIQADGALFCRKFGDLGIQERSWPFIGRIEPWDRRRWPLPEFGRIENEPLGIAWICTYVNDDIGKLPVERRCTPEEARRHPQDILAGCDAAAGRLGAMITGKNVPW